MWLLAVLGLFVQQTQQTQHLRSATVHRELHLLRAHHQASVQPSWLLTASARGPAPALRLGVFYRASFDLAWAPRLGPLGLFAGVSWQPLGRPQGRWGPSSHARSWPQPHLLLTGSRGALALGAIDGLAPPWAGRRRDGWRAGSRVGHGAGAWTLWASGPGRLVLHSAAGWPRVGARGRTGASSGATALLAEGSLAGRLSLGRTAQAWLLAQGHLQPLGSGPLRASTPAAPRVWPRSRMAQGLRPPWSVALGSNQMRARGSMHLWAAARPRGQRLMGQWAGPISRTTAGYRRTNARGDIVFAQAWRGRTVGAGVASSYGLHAPLARHRPKPAKLPSIAVHALVAPASLPFGARAEVFLRPNARGALAGRTLLTLRLAQPGVDRPAAARATIGWLWPERTLVIVGQAQLTWGPMGLQLRGQWRRPWAIAPQAPGGGGAFAAMEAFYRF